MPSYTEQDLLEKAQSICKKIIDFPVSLSALVWKGWSHSSKAFFKCKQRWALTSLHLCLLRTRQPGGGVL